MTKKEAAEFAAAKKSLRTMFRAGRLSKSSFDMAMKSIEANERTARTERRRSK